MGNLICKCAIFMMDKIGIENPIGFISWTICRSTELGIPHFWVAKDEKNAFKHKYPIS
jgi:hypothetical protein